jgi:glycosyltransferase involved in cell wall biosynthesis
MSGEMSRPRILHVISSLHVGGAERMLVKICGATRTTFAHDIIALLPGGALAGDARAAGATVEEYEMQRSWSALAAIPRLRRHIAATRPDLVMGWMYHASAVASVALVGSGGRPPLLWNIRHTPRRLRDETLLTRAALLAGIPLGRAAAGIVYNAERSAQRHEALFYDRRRKIVIPNGFDVALYRPDPEAGALFRAEHGLPADAPLLGRVARSHPMKDDGTLIAAFARVQARYPQARLVLAGSGMDAGNAALMALASGAGVSERLVLLGPRTDIAAITPAFDVALSSSSRGEAFPNVVGEAMACGVPVVATDVGDSAGIIADVARIAPPGDPEALAACVLRLLDGGAALRQETGRRDRERVLARYGLDVVAARYAALWRETIAATPQRG